MSLDQCHQYMVLLAGPRSPSVRSRGRHGKGFGGVRLVVGFSVESFGECQMFVTLMGGV